MKKAKIVIVSPALRDANNGNWQTARRWQQMLRPVANARIVRQWPDSHAAQAPEAAQQDADYDRWFHAKVQASLAGLKDGTNKVLTDVEVQERRAALRARLQDMHAKRAV